MPTGSVVILVIGVATILVALIGLVIKFVELGRKSPVTGSALER